MFLDMIIALQSANAMSERVEVPDQKVGWNWLLRMKPELESMVEDKEASPLVLAAGLHAAIKQVCWGVPAGIHVPIGAGHDPHLAAISLLKRLYRELVDFRRGYWWPARAMTRFVA